MNLIIDTRQFIGDIGEQVVQEFFNSNRSEDWFDSEKDGTVSGMTYEVKTFRLNFSTRGFWLGQNKSKTMWKKVDEVDMLFFIRIPEREAELASLYLCIDHRNCWTKQYRNDGTGVRCYPLNRCIKLCTLSPERSIKLYENSIKISSHERKPIDD